MCVWLCVCACLPTAFLCVCVCMGFQASVAPKVEQTTAKGDPVPMAATVPRRAKAVKRQAPSVPAPAVVDLSSDDGGDVGVDEPEGVECVGSSPAKRSKGV